MKVVNLMCEHMLCDEKTYRKAPFCIDAENPVFSFALEGENNGKMRFYRIVVATSKDKLTTKSADMWDSGIIYDDDTSYIRYEGKELESRTTYYFCVYAVVGDEKVKSEPGVFTTGIYYRSQWGCIFIGVDSKNLPKLDCPFAGFVGLPAPHMRKCFNVGKGLVSAKAYATAFGVYELYVNGERAGNYELAPEWTNYAKSIQYQYYDLTDLLKPGENAIGAIVGDGWYTGSISTSGKGQYGDVPVGFIMNLTLEYEDGSVDTVVTDGSWKGSAGPFEYTDNQHGEYYDATKELDGWCTPGYDDSAWCEVIGVSPVKCRHTRFKASMGAQISENITIEKAVSVEFDKDGRVIVDMGQNMVGHISLKMKGIERGTKLMFRHGEILNDDGTLYTTNLRSAQQCDMYVCKGGEEMYKPHFTFHGFRFVEISGLKELPNVDDIQGHVVYSACHPTGSVETGVELVNKLFKNALWGQRGNFVGLPTDCPQRDERMGWTADTQVFCRSACYNMDCYGFFDKHLDDIKEAQKANGSIPDVCPIVSFDRGNGGDLVGEGTAAWGDVIFILPYIVYTMYGDIRIINKAYDSMARYFKHLIGTTTNLIRPARGYGDWLSIDDDTPLDVLATAFFAYAAHIMSKCARLLGRCNDEQYYKKMYKRIKEAWFNEYVSYDGMIKGDTQCCYVLALKMKLVPREMERTIAEHLMRTIKRKNYHIHTGFVGISYIMPILCDYGYSDVAYRMLQNETYPSWGYSIVNGATTIWERWNSYTKEYGLGDAAMNSFNHYSLGSVVEWMYAYMGGIKPKKAGFKEFYIKPYFNDTIGPVKCSYNSISGTISTAWEQTEEGYELTVTAPVNTTAYLMFDPENVCVLQGEGVRELKNCVVFNGGTYKFLIK